MGPITVPEGFDAERGCNGVHIFPVGDIFAHTHINCACRVSGKVYLGVPYYTHNRFDGADLIAAAEQGLPVT